MQEEEEERKKEEAINTHGWKAKKDTDGEEIELTQPKTISSLDPATLDTTSASPEAVIKQQDLAGTSAPECVDFDPESQTKFY